MKFRPKREILKESKEKGVTLRTSANSEFPRGFGFLFSTLSSGPPCFVEKKYVILFLAISQLLSPYDFRKDISILLLSPYVQDATLETSLE